jgi:hypothetical protein
MHEYTTNSEDQKIERSTNTALLLDKPLTSKYTAIRYRKKLHHLFAMIHCLIATILFKDKVPTEYKYSI